MGPQAFDPLGPPKRFWKEISIALFEMKTKMAFHLIKFIISPSVSLSPLMTMVVSINGVTLGSGGVTLQRSAEAGYTLTCMMWNFKHVIV